VTHKGHLGLASKHVQTGDIIAILFGGQLPFVLRKVGNHYILIGEAYIDGIMDGEAAKQHDLDGENPRDATFEIW
jgi:hypothetical protein